VFPVDVAVGVEPDVARVGVLAHDNVSPRIPGQAEPLAHGGGVTAGFDGHIGAAATGALKDRRASLLLAGRGDVQGEGGAHPLRLGEALLWPPDDDDVSGAS